jgi:hypothetical protein
MYFMRDLALGIRRDWEGRRQSRAPRIYVDKVELMSPWLKANEAKRAKQADYVVVWDESYADLEIGRLSKDEKRRLGKLGPDVLTVRHHGRVAARVYGARP